MAILAVNPAEGQFFKRATAFHVGDGVFYTNAHVVRASLPPEYTEMYLANTVSTRNRDSWLGPVTVTCVHAWWRGDPEAERAYPFDVAQLQVADRTNLPPAMALSSERPFVGMHVAIEGFAAASRAWPPKLYTAIGHISEVNPNAQTFTIEVEAGFAMEGSSGSPVLNDAHAVIGIIFARQGARDRSAAHFVAAITTQGIQSSCR